MTILFEAGNVQMFTDKTPLIFFGKKYEISKLIVSFA